MLVKSWGLFSWGVFDGSEFQSERMQYRQSCVASWWREGGRRRTVQDNDLSLGPPFPGHKIVWSTTAMFSPSVPPSLYSLGRGLVWSSPASGLSRPCPSLPPPPLRSAHFPFGSKWLILVVFQWSVSDLSGLSTPNRFYSNICIVQGAQIYKST